MGKDAMVRLAQVQGDRRIRPVFVLIAAGLGIVGLPFKTFAQVPAMLQPAPRAVSQAERVDAHFGKLREEAALRLGIERHQFRRFKNPGQRILEMQEAARRVKERPTDSATFVANVMTAFSSPDPAWTEIVELLAQSRGGKDWDHASIQLIRSVLSYPRGEKISDSHGGSLREGIRLLGEIGTPSAVSLLEECLQSEFWRSSGPIRSRILSESPQESIEILARLARDALITAEASDTDNHNFFGPESVSTASHYGLNERQTLTALRQTAYDNLDAVAVSLWASIMREDMPPDIMGKIVRECHEARYVDFPESTQDALLEDLAEALKIESPDWAFIDQLLWTLFFAKNLDAAFLPHFRSVLVSPRTPPLEEYHREAILAALFAVSRIQGTESVDLLLDAMTREFWEENGPIEVPSRLRDEVDPIEQTRIRAMAAFGHLPSILIEHHLIDIRDQYRNQQANVAGPAFSEFRHMATPSAEKLLRDLAYREAPLSGGKTNDAN